MPAIFEYAGQTYETDHPEVIEALLRVKPEGCNRQDPGAVKILLRFGLLTGVIRHTKPVIRIGE